MSAAGTRKLPVRTRQSTILGPNGKPVTYFLYPSPRQNLRAYKPRYWLAADTKSNVSEYDRWELVNYSRQLFAQITNLATAIQQKNSWAFGDAWDAHYCGRNLKWGEEAQEYLKNLFYPTANVRGTEYDFKTSLKLSGMAWDFDGDDAMVLTESASGFPQLAFYPATRIGMVSTGQRGAREPGTVQGGPYDGAKIFDGVVYDRNNRMIALQISSEGNDPVYISSFNCHLGYEPTWHDQGRGIPRIATSLLRWMNLQDIDEFLQRGIKRAASIGLKFKNEEGEAAVGNEVVTSELDLNATTTAGQENVGGGGTSPKVYYEELEGGEMYYLNSTTGEEIEGLTYQNPHPNTEAFIERIERGAIASVGWFLELLNLSESGRAASRLVCDLANQSIWDRQSAGMRRAKRAIIYAVAKGMKGGFISKNDDGIDPYMWEFGLPKQLSVDAGNDEAADRENLKMGTTSKAIIAQKKGYHRKEIERQRQAEVEDLIVAAKALSDKHPEVGFDRAMDLLEQRNPNGTPIPKNAPAGGAGPVPIKQR